MAQRRNSGSIQSRIQEAGNRLNALFLPAQSEPFLLLRVKAVEKPHFCRAVAHFFR